MFFFWSKRLKKQRVNDTIAIVGLVQSIFGILIFTLKRPGHLSFTFLIIWLALIAIFLGSRLLPFQVVDYFKPGIFPILFLFGPLLYLYISSLTIENFKIRPVFLLHLLPFLLVCVHRSTIHPVPISSSNNLTVNPNYIYNKIYYSLFILSIFAYWFWSLKLIFNHRKNIPFNFSNYTSKNTLSWLIFVLTIFLVLFLADFSMSFMNKVLGMNVPRFPILSLNLTLFTYIMVLFGINQSVLFKTKIHVKGLDTLKTENSEEIKNGHPLMDKKQLEELSEIILKYLECSKPYLNPDYSLQMMADDLKISRQKLSYLINSGQHKNFYKFINEFRVKEVKHKLNDPAYKHYTVLAIGLDCGFNSKTSFNRIFKEETGLTPSEFKRIHIEN